MTRAGSCLRRGTYPVLLAGLLLSPPDGLEAQSWSTSYSSRQVAGQSELDVRIRYGAGSVRVSPADPGTLYELTVEYDEEVARPLADYTNGRLVAGVESIRGVGPFRRGGREGELNLRITQDIPVDLEAEFGAVRGDLDLGGIHLRRLSLSTGASDARLRASAPNPTRMSRAEMRVGAASFQAVELANLNAERYQVEAGVGDVTLDFGGSWRGDARADLRIGMGSLEIRIPDDVGVRIHRRTLLTSLDAPGFRRDGDDLVSANWDDAEWRLELHVSAAMGSIRIQHGG